MKVIPVACEREATQDLGNRVGQTSPVSSLIGLDTGPDYLGKQIFGTKGEGEMLVGVSGVGAVLKPGSMIGTRSGSTPVYLGDRFARSRQEAAINDKPAKYFNAHR